MPASVNLIAEFFGISREFATYMERSTLLLLSILTLLLLATGCSPFEPSDPEYLFKEHVAYMLEQPISSKNNPVEAKGVFEDDSSHNIVALLTPEGMALIRSKAKEGTVEERVLATRLYVWYAACASIANDPMYKSNTFAESVELIETCVGLVDSQTMIDLFNGLKDLDIPQSLTHHYESCELYIQKVTGETTGGSGSAKPPTQN